MAINTLDFAKKFTGELDKMLVQKAVTGFFADDALKAKFVGAKTVMIPSMTLSGAGDYDRDNGFPQGSIGVTNESYELTQDRAATFHLDRMDYDETGIAELAGSTLGEFVRTKMAPEMDAYNISKLYGIANGKSQVETYADPLTTFITLRKNVSNAAGFGDDELVCFINPDVWAEFQSSDKISRMIVPQEFKKGELSLTVKSIDGVSLIPVDSARMKSAYEFYDGSSNSGFAPASDASDVKMLMLPKKGASLVKKTEKLRTFTPDVNQSKDAYKFDYRLYYDLFVKKSREGTIFAAK